MTDTKKPLVFISHDARDADIAEAFTYLLTDASGGVLQTFRSSDRRGVSGIEFGAEWYRTIMDRLDRATDVVALLTTYSLNRPWILYEAGVAKGKLDRVVFGLALGIPLGEANIGPFAQFQNSGDDEDSLTKLVTQLIRRNPDAAPREEAVRRQVIEFRSTLAELMKDRHETSLVTPTATKSSEDVAKLFEEVKAMFRELPTRLDGTLQSRLGMAMGRRGKLRARMVADLVYNASVLEPGERIASWLIATTSFRDDLPWLYDTLIEVNRAVMAGNTNTVRELAHNLYRLLDTPHVDFLLGDLLERDGEYSVPIITLIRQMPERLRLLAEEIDPRRSLAGDSEPSN